MHGRQRDSASPADAGPGSRRAEVVPAADPFACGSDSGPGPVFYATYDSECAADDCVFNGTILEDDAIQADGQGGFAHAECASA